MYSVGLYGCISVCLCVFAIGLASCATRHRHSTSVNSFAPSGSDIKSVRLSNSTPKTDANLFSCLGALELDTLFVSYAETSLVRVSSLKLFIHVVPSCAIRRLFALSLLLSHGRALFPYIYIHVHQICKIRAENSLKKCKRPFRV